MVKGVIDATEDWKYEAITLGFPGIVRDGKVARNPLNLAGGWMDFDFEKAFKKPVRIINDAAMQALASYESGRMLFMGLGTSVGATLIVDDTVIPLEIGLMPLSKSEAFMDRLSKEALNTGGKRRWQRSVERAIALLQDIFFPDVFQLGGGNAKHIDPLPEKCVRGDNQDGFRGAMRMWPGADMLAEPLTTTWRIKRNGKVKEKEKEKK
jgi:polyphosphate glucokinase